MTSGGDDGYFVGEISSRVSSGQPEDGTGRQWERMVVGDEIWAFINLTNYRDRRCVQVRFIFEQ